MTAFPAAPLDSRHGRARPVRRRLTIAMVGVVAGALLVTGVGTLLLLRAEARRNTRRDLIQVASNLAGSARLVGRPQANALRLFLRRTQDMAVLQIPHLPSEPLPRGLSPADLHPDRLRLGQTVAGFDGAFTYSVVPFRARGGQLFAVALTQPASAGGPAIWYFLLSAGVALVVAAAVAGGLARRITRPLIEANHATRRIADGDLSVRVPINPQGSDELTSLSESINGMATSLERLRNTERQFLMSVSHDLRTPLTSIRGFAEALADGTATDTTRAADVIASEARRLERLVRDLLDLAKLDANRFSLNLRPVDLREVIDDTADGFLPSAERLGLQLIVHDPVTLGAGGQPLAQPQPATGPPVAADPDRLAQVVANLIENAMNFAATTVEVATWFRFNPDGQATAQITVDDDGPGIPASDLGHVFDRLWTSHRDRGRKVGSGLGLAIVAELIGAMSGSVQAESPVPRSGAGGGARPGSDLPGEGSPGAAAGPLGTRVAVTLRCWSTTVGARSTSTAPSGAGRDPAASV